MTKQTLDFIHQSYQEALARSRNIIQIIENLYDILKNAEVSDEDSKTYDAFIDGLRNCLKMRQMTSDITDVVTYITITMMHIIKWLNISKQIDIDIILHGRRKSLESDLTKLLRKSNQTLSAKIHDRFGLRGTLLNESETLAIEYIYLIEDSITGILAAKNRKMRKDFIDWVENSDYVNRINKEVIAIVLDIPFDVDCRKDYIKSPKPNGYESLHFILTIQPYTDVIPGSHLEIQLRTKKMNTTATSGSASHKEYKKYLNENVDMISSDNSSNDDEDIDVDTDSFDDSSKEDNPLTKVFVVDDFSKLNISGFKSYNSKEDDADGIHFSKDFANRRISSSLVPSTNII